MISMDKGQGFDSVNITPQQLIKEAAKWKGVFTLDKWDFPEEIREDAEAMMKAGASIDEVKAKYGDKYYIGRFDVGENLLLNEGINALWTLLAGGAETAYNAANARLGVGDQTTAEAATQTQLDPSNLSANELYVAMDSGFPTYGTSQKITFRATFTSAQANFAWAEFSADNGATASKNLNRKVSAQGTKVSGQTWQLTLEITLS